MVSIVKSEETSQIAVVSAESSLDVSQQTAIVLALQLHVHHIILFLNLFAFPLAVLRRLVVDLDVLHGVVRQVVEHHFVVAFEEIFAVECQVVNLLAVDIDVTVVFQLCAGHLADETVEHGTFRKVEGGSVVDYCVTAVSDFHFRSRYDNTLQRALCEDAVLLHFLLQQHARNLKLTIAGDILHVVIDVTRVIAFALGLDNEMVGFARNIEFVVGVTCSPRKHPTGCGIDHSAVLVHQGDVGRQRCLRE